MRRFYVCPCVDENFENWYVKILELNGNKEDFVAGHLEIAEEVNNLPNIIGQMFILTGENIGTVKEFVKEQMSFEPREDADGSYWKGAIHFFKKKEEENKTKPKRGNKKKEVKENEDNEENELRGTEETEEHQS